MPAAQCPVRTLRFGFFDVDLRAAELRKHGIRIKVQEQPFHILTLLLERSGDIATREELRQKLWPAHTFVDFDRSLNKAMTKLRAALGDSPESPRYIETLHRRGYRFLAPITVIREDTAESNVHLNDAAVERAAIAHENGQSQNHPKTGFLLSHTRPPATWTRFSLLLGTSTVLVCLIALFFLRVNHSVALGSSFGNLSPRRSVAVLGFRNLSGDTQKAWLSTALSDWLTTELSAGEQLRTIPSESVARMRIELSLPKVDSLGAASLASIRKNLGTDLVVVGSYAVVGEQSHGQIRLDLQLQDTQSGETVDAISETGTEAHLFDLVSRAGEHLRDKLGIRAVTREEAAAVAVALPSSTEAARLYSEGLAKLRIFDALAAHDLLLKSVAKESNYALSHAALATAWGQLGYDENAKAEAKKAFDLSANLSRAERLLVEGRYRETSREWNKAIEIYRALFEFFPDNLDYGLALAIAQVSANKWKDALDTIAMLREMPSPLRDDPRIDLAEDDAARSLGDTKRAEAALARAAERARATGATLLLATARLDQAWLFENLGRLDEVEGVVREAMPLYVAANDRRGVARALTLKAIAQEDQGDYLGAKKGYEESLAIYRELGCKLSLASEYINIGGILVHLGDLPGARGSFEQALATYAEIRDQDGVALAKNGLGDVFQALGKLTEAKAIFGEALEICRQIGNRSRQASSLAGLGGVLRFEGDAAAARKDEMEAKGIFEEIGDKSSAAQANLHLARLFLDEDKSADAIVAARRAAEVFEKTKASADEAAANLVLSRALLAQGKIVEARESVELAWGVAKETHSRELELLATITAARVRASSGNAADRSEAAKRLNAVIGEATTAGFTDVALEARLVLGAIEMGSGDAANGRAHLEALEKDADRKGFGLVARKARAVLRSGSENLLVTN
jgi:eukaryotic-like serine/threonine-protein kinase